MIENLVREEIKGFKNYEVHSIPYRYKMDANETPFELPEEVIKKYSRDCKIFSSKCISRPYCRKVKRRIGTILWSSAYKHICGKWLG